MRDTTREFKALNDLELIKLITEKSQKEISDIYKVDQAYVSKELSRRNIFKPKNNKSYSCETKMMSENEDDYGFDYWKCSVERLAIKQYNKL